MQTVFAYPLYLTDSHRHSSSFPPVPLNFSGARMGLYGKDDRIYSAGCELPAGRSGTRRCLGRSCCRRWAGITTCLSHDCLHSLSDVFVMHVQDFKHRMLPSWFAFFLIMSIRDIRSLPTGQRHHVHHGKILCSYPGPAIQVSSGPPRCLLEDQNGTTSFKAGSQGSERHTSGCE